MPRHAPFAAGNSGGGRRAGARNRLQTSFLEDLANEWAEHGRGVIRIVRTEKPVEFMKAVIAVLPKELVLEQNMLADMTDEDIAAYLSMLQRMQLNKEANKQEETGASDEATQH
jgi:hypothetical protein